MPEHPRESTDLTADWYVRFGLTAGLPLGAAALSVGGWVLVAIATAFVFACAIGGVALTAWRDASSRASQRSRDTPNGAS